MIYAYVTNYYYNFISVVLDSSNIIYGLIGSDSYVAINPLASGTNKFVSPMNASYF